MKIIFTEDEIKGMIHNLNTATSVEAYVVMTMLQDRLANTKNKSIPEVEQ